VRIAWDMQALTGPRPTGLGVAVRLLLDALTAHCAEFDILPLYPNAQDRPLHGVPDRLAWEQWRLPRAVAQVQRADSLDLLYSPALGAPLRCAIPVVAHVHDLIALRYPEQFSGVAGWYWQRLLPACWRRCRAITVSNASLVDEVSQRLPYPRARIHVVPYYPNPALLQAAQALRLSSDPEGRPFGALPYFVMLASCEPRKNIELALRALGMLKRDGMEAGLLCIGLRTAHTNQLLALAEQEQVAQQVRFSDYLPLQQVARHLLDCTALLFLSRYEGYGMPPQEAQSIGCPVVLSDIPCHRAVYCDPQRLAQLPVGQYEAPPLVGVDDMDSLAELLHRLLRDDEWRGQLAASGQTYCGTFTPQATAQALRRAFLAALA
jgi:glycosyltransferase involved in cell wall biosynthesis